MNQSLFEFIIFSVCGWLHVCVCGCILSPCLWVSVLQVWLYFVIVFVSNFSVCVCVTASECKLVASTEYIDSINYCIGQT